MAVGNFGSHGIERGDCRVRIGYMQDGKSPRQQIAPGMLEAVFHSVITS